MRFDFSQCPDVRKLMAQHQQRDENEEDFANADLIEVLEAGGAGENPPMEVEEENVDKGEERVPEQRERVNQIGYGCLDMVKRMRLQQKQKEPGQPSSSSSAGKKLSAREEKLFAGISPELAKQIMACILDDRNTQMLSMDEIKGNTAAKLALEECVVLPSVNPRLFTGLRAPCTGILLFGPPGNGKTMLAKAVARQCKDHTFFSVSAATIMSKWVGEGERMVQALFQVARRAQPSVIFIDEVDSMLCQRQDNEHDATRRVKTEFLVQLDGCGSQRTTDRVLVLGATNRPYELDEAMLRRFPKRIFIDLPSGEARAEMIRRTFEENQTAMALGEEDLSTLAALTEHYSYSDLTALCRAAAMCPLRSVDRLLLPTFEQHQLRAVDMTDFEQALAAVKPSTSGENRRRLVEFAQKYAQMAA